MLDDPLEGIGQSRVVVAQEGLVGEVVVDVEGQVAGLGLGVLAAARASRGMATWLK